MGGRRWQLALIVGLVLPNALFSGSEMAVARHAIIQVRLQPIGDGRAGGS